MGLLHLGPEALTFVTVTLSSTFLLGLVLVWWSLRNPIKDLGFQELTVSQVEVNGLSFRYHRSGRGPCLVLLHGIGANLYCWRTLIPRLNQKYSVLALDLPGFGQSSKPLDGSYGLDDQVDRLRSFFAHLGIKQLYMIGNSMGGNIALWYAVRHPEQVLGTVVIAPATSPRLIPISAKNWLWLAGPMSLLTNRTAMKWAHRRTVSKKHLVNRERVEETFKTYGGEPAAIRSFLLATEAIRDRRLPQALKDIRGRVLILWGSRDRLVPRSVITELESALLKAESHVHMGGGHHLQEDEPEWVAEKIDAFLD